MSQPEREGLSYKLQMGYETIGYPTYRRQVLALGLFASSILRQSLICRMHSGLCPTMEGSLFVRFRFQNN